jgi:hypothetical protein
MKITLGLKKYKLILLFISLGNPIGFSQEQIMNVNQKVYNEKLQLFSLDSIIQKVNTIVVIANTSCIGCVEYLLKEKICYNYIYLIANLSITEMNRVKFKTDNKNCHFYFLVSKFQTNPMLISEKSPVLIYLRNSFLYFYNYDALNKLTNSFTLKGKKLNKFLQLKY